MREPTYYVLAALLDERLHGYGIIKRAAEMSDGDVRITAGTLYGAIDRLIDQGLVAADGEEIVVGTPAPLLPHHRRGPSGRSPSRRPGCAQHPTPSSAASSPRPPHR